MLKSNSVSTLPSFYTLNSVQGVSKSGELSPRVQNLSEVFPDTIFVNGTGYHVLYSGDVGAYITGLVANSNAINPVSFSSLFLLTDTAAHKGNSGEITIENKPESAVLLMECAPYVYTGEYFENGITDDLSD